MKVSKQQLANHAPNPIFVEVNCSIVTPDRIHWLLHLTFKYLKGRLLCPLEFSFYSKVNIKFNIHVTSLFSILISPTFNISTPP